MNAYRIVTPGMTWADVPYLLLGAVLVLAGTVLIVAAVHGFWSMRLEPTQETPAAELGEGT